MSLKTFLIIILVIVMIIVNVVIPVRQYNFNKKKIKTDEINRKVD